MKLVITATGQVRSIYDETIDLCKFGKPVISRGSHVEPTAEGKWTADLSPVGGPRLGPFDRRSQALNAEHEWLRNHWLEES